MPYLPSCMQERDRTESREGVVRRGGYPSLLLTQHGFISRYSSKCSGTGSGFLQIDITYYLWCFSAISYCNIHIKDKTGTETLTSDVYRRSRVGSGLRHFPLTPALNQIKYNTVVIAVLRIRDVYLGSRILIFTHPGSRISDPGSKNSNKREGWKKICYHTFFCSHKFHRIVNYFIFEVLKKKILVSFQISTELFIHKIVISSQKYGFGIRDTRSGIGKNLSRIRVQWSKRHRIPDPQHWVIVEMKEGCACLLLASWPR